MNPTPAALTHEEASTLATDLFHCPMSCFTSGDLTYEHVCFNFSDALRDKLVAHLRNYSASLSALRSCQRESEPVAWMISDPAWVVMTRYKRLGEGPTANSAWSDAAKKLKDAK